MPERAAQAVHNAQNAFSIQLLPTHFGKKAFTKWMSAGTEVDEENFRRTHYFADSNFSIF